jgi:hypothetical protein
LTEIFIIAKKYEFFRENYGILFIKAIPYIQICKAYASLLMQPIKNSPFSDRIESFSGRLVHSTIYARRGVCQHFEQREALLGLLIDMNVLHNHLGFAVMRDNHGFLVAAHIPYDFRGLGFQVADGFDRVTVFHEPLQILAIISSELYSFFGNSPSADPKAHPRFPTRIIPLNSPPSLHPPQNAYIVNLPAILTDREHL